MVHDIEKKKMNKRAHLTKSLLIYIVTHLVLGFLFFMRDAIATDAFFPNKPRDHHMQSTHIRHPTI